MRRLSRITGPLALLAPSCRHLASFASSSHLSSTTSASTMSSSAAGLAEPRCRGSRTARWYIAAPSAWLAVATFSAAALIASVSLPSSSLLQLGERLVDVGLGVVGILSAFSVMNRSVW